MREKKIDCVILGLLSHEELTGYEIKRRIDSSLSYFWGASYGSIYPALSALVSNGLAERRYDEESSRSKQIYSITDKGRAYLREWLLQPVQRDELRYETLLKLFFGSEAGAEATAEHIAAFREKTEKALGELLRAREVLKAHLDEDVTHRYYLLTVEFGISTYEGYLKYCDEAIEALGEM